MFCQRGRDWGVGCLEELAGGVWRLVVAGLGEGLEQRSGRARWVCRGMELPVLGSLLLPVEGLLPLAGVKLGWRVRVLMRGVGVLLP